MKLSQERALRLPRTREVVIALVLFLWGRNVGLRMEIDDSKVVVQKALRWDVRIET